MTLPRLVTMIPGMTVSGDMIAAAALEAMSGTGGFASAEAYRAQFAAIFHAKLKANGILT